LGDRPPELIATSDELYHLGALQYKKQSYNNFISHKLMRTGSFYFKVDYRLCHSHLLLQFPQNFSSKYLKIDLIKCVDLSMSYSYTYGCYFINSKYIGSRKLCPVGFQYLLPNISSFLYQESARGLPLAAKAIIPAAIKIGHAHTP